MTYSNKTFRQRLLEGELLVGTFVKTPSRMLAEVLAQTDLDALCFDAEHSPFDRGDIDGCALACRSENMPALVRVASAAPELALTALDCGMTGVVVPHVDSVHKAESMARAARYGDGGRGYAGSPRAARYGGHSMMQNLKHSRNDTTVIAQIEDLAALDAIDEIAAVDGIDALFIGMMDLTVALGASGPADDAVLDAALRICAAAVKAGRRLGIFVPDTRDIPVWRERGVSLFLLQSDHVFLKAGAARLMSASGATIKD